MGILRVRTIKDKKEATRNKRHERLRKRVFGTPQKPRLSIHKSHQNLFAQLIDDLSAKTVCAASTQDKTISGGTSAHVTKTQKAKLLGESLAKKALAAGLKEVVFDRGGFKYHGRIKAFAEGARQNGLKF